MCFRLFKMTKMYASFPLLKEEELCVSCRLSKGPIDFKSLCPPQIYGFKWRLSLPMYLVEEFFHIILRWQHIWRRISMLFLCCTQFYSSTWTSTDERVWHGHAVQVTTVSYHFVLLHQSTRDIFRTLFPLLFNADSSDLGIKRQFSSKAYC